MMTATSNAFMANALSIQQSSSTAAPSIQQPNIYQLQQLQNIQLMATQLGYQLNLIQSPRPQAYFGSRSFNNNRGSRGSRGSSRGNSRGGFNNRPRDSSGTRQFSWASTQNTVYGHCNRCGIGHLPSQCLTQSNQSQPAPHANFTTCSEVGPSSGPTWKPDTAATHHATPDLASMDSSEAYYGRVYTHYPPFGPQ
ncbi:hypothetical protein HanIR_Chr08g0353601 [Helianthus annuus]|nr:hypothetical protein HanIR_Chr08g0353601 [Helianthus annuus]